MKWTEKWRVVIVRQVALGGPWPRAAGSGQRAARTAAGRQSFAGPCAFSLPAARRPLPAARYFAALTLVIGSGSRTGPT